jgi:hypothetical protein
VFAGRERRARLQFVTAEEVRCKSPACCSLQGGSRGGPFGRRLRCQPLQPRLIALLHKLLALELAVLCLEQPLLRALCPQAFRLLRLQLLHALLQAIDAALALCALARKHLTLPLLHYSLPLRGSFSRRLRSEPLQACLIALQLALLALQQAVLGLQQVLLRALRPQAFRLLRLQLLYTLLQAIDAALALCALARKRRTLPLLDNLLSLLDALLALLRTRCDLLLP